MSQLNLTAFLEHLTTSGLVPPGSRGVVGYSGGADSAALVHLFSLLKVDIVAAHLHHGMRDEADEEMAKCEEFADAFGVPFLAGRADIPQFAAEQKIGLEEAGREARYSFLRQAAVQTGSDWIATAHTRTDHVETILFHAIRGSGLTGLAGIRPRRDEIIHPLLPYDRADTRDYCVAHGLWFHDDPANTDVQFARSRLREKVLPELAKINPSFAVSLERLAELVDDEDRFLNSMAAAALEQAERPPNGELAFLTRDVELVFDAHVLRHLPTVLRRRALRLAFQFLGEPLDREQSQLVTDGIGEATSGSMTASGGQTVGEWDSTQIHIRKLDVSRPARFPLEFPGETDSETFGWTISVDEEKFQGQPQARQDLRVAVNRSAVKAPLHLRAIEPGDRMRPLGFSGSRKASDLMGELGLTEAARRRLPLIADFAGPLWIPGVCLDDRVSIGPDTERVLVLNFRSLD